MERIILKREDFAMRAGESEKGWGGWCNDFERQWGKANNN
jgi:hypothetical protein